MKLTLEVQADFTKLRSVMRQFPFASALALTKTAQDAQVEVRRELPRRFTIRNSWLSQGVRVQFATKANLESVVYQKDDFMVLQETGGSHRPRGASLAVPIAARENKRNIVPAGRRPNALKGKPGVFRATIRGLDGLWQRRQKKRVPLRLLFVFKRSVPVRARFGFVATVKKVVRERFARQFELAFDRAIKTAR